MPKFPGQYLENMKTEQPITLSLFGFLTTQSNNARKEKPRGRSQKKIWLRQCPWLKLWLRQCPWLNFLPRYLGCLTKKKMTEKTKKND